MIKRFLNELKNKGWKQKEIAEKAKTSQGYISELMQGGKCGIEIVINLADAFEVSVDEVLGREIPRTISKTQELLIKMTDDEDIARAALKCAQDEKLLKEVRGKGRGRKAA